MATQFRMIESTAPQEVRISWQMLLPADETATSPDMMSDGYWPSTDPESAGYIGGDAATIKARWRVELDKATQRLDGWAHDRWNYVGVQAKAILFIPIGGSDFATYEITSPGLWGIESDSGDYLREVFAEQKAELRANLETLARALLGVDALAEEDAE